MVYGSSRRWAEHAQLHDDGGRVELMVYLVVLIPEHIGYSHDLGFSIYKAQPFILRHIAYLVRKPNHLHNFTRS